MTYPRMIELVPTDVTLRMKIAIFLIKQIRENIKVNNNPIRKIVKLYILFSPFTVFLLRIEMKMGTLDGRASIVEKMI